MSNLSTQQIDKCVRFCERPSLLRFMQIPQSTQIFGDFEGARAISASSVSSIEIYRDDAPLFGTGSRVACSGAILCRYARATVGLPCWSPNLVAGSAFCAHCKEIWGDHNSRSSDWFSFDADSMPAAAEFYKPGHKSVLWNNPAMISAKELFSEEITVIKDLLAGSEWELGRDWPGMGFREVSESVLAGAGVLYKDAARSSNPYRRDAWQEQRLKDYLHQMIKAWLRIRATVEPEAFNSHLTELQNMAKNVSKAAMWAVQQKNDEPVLVGPIVAADVMLSGFTAAASTRFSAMVHNAHEEKENCTEIPVFSWGAHVNTLAEWAERIPHAARPRRAAKRHDAGASAASMRTPTKSFYAVTVGLQPGIYDTDAEAKQQRDPSNPTAFRSKRCRSRASAEAFIKANRLSTPVKKVSGGTEDITSPSQVKRWFAAKATMRPGLYAHRQVADSYNVDGKGIIKSFASYVDARKWLEMPAPRFFLETECYQPAKTATQIYAVQGGAAHGVYFDIGEALAAANKGGIFAQFASYDEASVFAQGPPVKDNFVVWVGRTVGIMTQEQCVSATQRLKNAKMRGPLSEDKAFAFWETKAAAAVVVSEPTSPAAPAARQWFYGVQKGRVPGVYKFWKHSDPKKSAEFQVRGVRPNLYAKFSSEQEAKEFVNAGLRASPAAASTAGNKTFAPVQDATSSPRWTPPPNDNKECDLPMCKERHCRRTCLQFEDGSWTLRCAVHTSMSIPAGVRYFGEFTDPAATKATGRRCLKRVQLVSADPRWTPPSNWSRTKLDPPGCAVTSCPRTCLQFDDGAWTSHCAVHTQLTVRADVEYVADHTFVKKTAASQLQAAGKKQALVISLPVDAALANAEASNQTRVFACHTQPGFARVALSFQEAAAGKEDPTASVFGKFKVYIIGKSFRSRAAVAFINSRKAKDDVAAFTRGTQVHRRRCICFPCRHCVCVYAGGRRRGGPDKYSPC